MFWAQIGGKPPIDPDPAARRAAVDSLGEQV
jgi:hypothetical protein